MILYSIFKLRKDKYSSPFFCEAEEPRKAAMKIKELQSDFGMKKYLEVFPPELHNVIKRAVSSNSASRPNINEFLINSWFNDKLVKGIYNLNEFYKLEEAKQKIYLKSFAQLIPKYTPKIIEQRIIPFLQEQLLNPLNMYEIVSILLYTCKKDSLGSKSKKK